MFLTFHNRQPSEPAIKHPVPPWSLVPQESWNKVAADLFRLYGHYCLLVVDYNSKFVTIEISQFLTVINKCKSQYGIPKKLIINNGLEFTSHHFKKFSKSWDLKLQTVSSRHHQLNGLVERSIKTVKQTFKKAKYDETRRIPCFIVFKFNENRISPAQKLFNHKPRTNLPSFKLLLPQNPYITEAPRPRKMTHLLLHSFDGVYKS